MHEWQNYLAWSTHYYHAAGRGASKKLSTDRYKPESNSATNPRKIPGPLRMDCLRHKKPIPYIRLQPGTQHKKQKNALAPAKICIVQLESECQVQTAKQAWEL